MPVVQSEVTCLWEHAIVWAVVTGRRPLTFSSWTFRLSKKTSLLMLMRKLLTRIVSERKENEHKLNNLSSRSHRFSCVLVLYSILSVSQRKKTQIPKS